MDTYTGLSYEGNNWVYYNNGKIDTSYTGLCEYNGSWWYVENGKVDFSANTDEYKERRQRLLDVREEIGYLPDRMEIFKGGMTIYSEVMTCYGSKYVVMCMPEDFCDMNNGIDLNAIQHNFKKYCMKY